MNKYEALQAMKFYKEKLYNGIFKDKIEAFDVAINALDRQIPKKPTHLDSVPHYRCPCCNDAVKLYEESPTYPIRHCNWCGQALDWSDTE